MGETTEGIAVGIAEEDLREWFNVARRSMLGAPLDAEAFEKVRGRFTELERCIAALDAKGQRCGSAYALSTELTVPGGSVPAAGVTAVGVLPTHRRQGHLTRMMKAQLSQAAERGEPVAALVAAEYPIYGRYGYGPAADACGVHIDAASLNSLPNDGFHAPESGHVELLDNDAFSKALPEIYERARARNAGHIRWTEDVYQMVAGLIESPFGGDTGQAPKAVWYDDSGEPQAAASYTLQQNWQGNRPLGTLTASPLVAATDEAHRELLRYLVNVDWIATVRVDLRPLDDPAPLWLRDGRVAQLVDHSDHLWVRVLDLPAALEARRYQARGELVIQVEDPMGFADGRFRLEVSPEIVIGDGHQPAHPARCVPTDAAPDLTVPVGALGAAYLGGVSWSRLAATGQVTEHSPRAVTHAAAMFTNPRAPWCAMTF